MRYVVTNRDYEKHENGLIVRIYRDKRLEFKECLILFLVSFTITLLVFSLGVSVGRYKAMQEAPTVREVEVTEVAEEVEAYSEEIPLTAEEQKSLRSASDEFGIDYYTMLGLIEKETNFRNVSGDGGKASGYCQIWRVYWKDLMDEIGARDLNVPEDNFRTACAIMRELTDRYGSVAGALTAYNKGSYDGTVSRYATVVMENAEKWRGI